MEQSNILGREENPPYVPTSDERTIAILCHALCLVTWLIAPLIIYILKKDESKYIADHARESINFQLTIAIISIILVITVIGIFVVWLVGIIAAICVIVASIKASENKLYRYPFTIRLIK